MSAALPRTMAADYAAELARHLAHATRPPRRRTRPARPEEKKP